MQACNPSNLNVSINSTSQDGCPDTAVAQQAKVANTSYSVLAINDLGMHCGDLDTRISSILPPFQVLLAQVIQKGATPTLNPAGVSVAYSAAANPNDPILTQDVFDGVRADGYTYKTNFWDGVAAGTYDPFYPGGMGITLLATGAFPVTADTGLPVPMSTGSRARACRSPPMTTTAARTPIRWCGCRPRTRPTAATAMTAA